MLEFLSFDHGLPSRSPVFDALPVEFPCFDVQCPLVTGVAGIGCGAGKTVHMAFGSVKPLELLFGLAIEVRAQVANYIAYNNSEHYQWTLKQMTPDEYRSHLLSLSNCFVISVHESGHSSYVFKALFLQLFI